MTQPVPSWGFGAWGDTPWGGGFAGGFSLLSVVAVAENVLRATFTVPLYFSGLLDVPDASQPSLWQASPIAGTVGYDGQPARPVTVVSVALDASGAAQPGAAVDLTLDRPMSPWPAQYALVTGVLYSSDLTLQLAGAVGTTPAVQLALVQPDVSEPHPGRDLANPDTFAQAAASTIALPYQTSLGSFGYSDNGDYAVDQRDGGLRKRLNRRLFTKPGGFLHLGEGYGVGVTTYVKRLNRGSTREQLAAKCEEQFAREPEVATVRVLSRLDPQNTGICRLDVWVGKKNGQSARYAMRFPVQ